MLLIIVLKKKNLKELVHFKYQHCKRSKRIVLITVLFIYYEHFKNSSNQRTSLCTSRDFFGKFFGSKIGRSQLMHKNKKI